MRISDWSSDVCSSDLLVDDVKAYDPNNSPLALPSTCNDHQAQLAAQKPLLYLATDIVYATDGAEAVLPSELSVEVRSEERRVGQECVSTCRSRCARYLYKKNNIKKRP